MNPDEITTPIPTSIPSPSPRRPRALVPVMVLALVLLQGASAPRARAQGGPCGAEPAAEVKDRARALHERAFELHKELRFDEAAETYVESLALWPHPRIHLQAGIAFLSALRLLDAYEHIHEAVRCGRDALEPDQLEEAERKLARLRTRLGQVAVDCDEPGAQVRFNDQPWFTCPGRRERVVVAGQYVIHVTKDGHYPVLEPVTVAAGELVLVEPKVLSLRDGTQVTRRWPSWMPWTVIGAGAALGALGTGMQSSARARMDRYLQSVSAECLPAGCAQTNADQLLGEHDRAITENRLALGALALGSAALVAGFTMAYLNRPERHPKEEAGSARIRALPMAGRDGAGLRLELDF